MTILSSGPLSTVQDLGRYGYMNTGFSSNGAMDAYSFTLANILVGNERNEGAIEMTFMGLTAAFDCDTVIAVTGADVCPEVNGNPIETYTAVQIRAGDTLSMKMAKSGMRAYLAVAGGFDIPLCMGSVSTNLKCKMGGFSGRKLAQGDEIYLKRGTRLLSNEKRSITPSYKNENEIKVRVILGPQNDFFTEKGIEIFLSSSYSVSDKSDRMGIRLDGEAIENKNGVDIISDGIVAGSVQIPASGTPIIMMADRQTTGGYAKIATVITADLPRVAQARPNDKIRFIAVNSKTAVKLLKNREKEFFALEKKILGK